MKMKLIGYVSMFVSAFYVGVTYVKAAADSDLATAIASSTGVLTDNKTQIIAYFAAVIVALLLIGMAKGALVWGSRSIKSIFGSRRRRK